MGRYLLPERRFVETQKRWKNICRYLTSKGVPFDYVQSEGPGSVERLASMMTRAGYRTIIIVGEMLRLIMHFVVL